ncbi:calcium-binding protein [Chitinimonas arctica]|nr:calcium-binding protein [Chitinimonas arctica]
MNIQKLSEQSGHLYSAQRSYTIAWERLTTFDNTDPGWGDYVEASTAFIHLAHGINSSLELIGRDPLFPKEVVSPLASQLRQYQQWQEYSHSVTDMASSMDNYAFNPTHQNLENVAKTSFDALGKAGAIILTSGIMVQNPAMIVIGAGLTLLSKYLGGDFDPLLTKISDLVADLFKEGQKVPQRRDPLVLDIDGDGVETVGVANSLVLFDHDADGIKTKTGWTRADDGFLVLDRNGNGTIDDGRELFGDATPLNGNGSMDTQGGIAANGFAALAKEDSNNDGKIDAADARWGRLRMWQDANQDGISQANELKTLAALNITAVNLANTEVNNTLADGNQIHRTGTFVRGGTVQTAATLGDAANLNFSEDTFHREFSDTLPIPTEFASLPELTGSGKVRDLKEAATQSSRLKGLVEQFAAATTQQAQLALVDQLLDAWADTSGMAESLDDRDPDHFIVRYDRIGDVLRSANIIANTGPGMGGGGSQGGGGMTPATPRDVDNTQLSANYRQLIGAWNQKLHILEAFNGRYFFNLPEQTQAGGGAASGITMVSGQNGGGGGGMGGTPIPTLSITYSTQQLSLLDQAYSALRESVYANLALQTRLKPYLLSATVSIGDDGYAFDFSATEQLLRNKVVQSPSQGLSDLIELNKYAGDHFGNRGWTGYSVMEDILRNQAATPELQALYTQLGILVGGRYGATTTGNAADNVVLGGTAAETVGGGAGNDFLFGGAGNDTLRGSEGNDYLDGGAGNDTVDGGTGSDTYRFGKSSGNDVIDQSYDTAANTDTLLLDAGIKEADVTVKRDGTGDDLLLTIAGASNVLRIKSYFHSDAIGPYSLEQIRFANGNAWNAEIIKATVIQGTAGKDTIVGYGGADVLDGGAGNDWLDGRGGNDTYKFGKNSGNDIIDQGYDTTVNTDTLLLDAGIAPADVTVKRDGTGDDLLLTIAGASNVLRIKSYFYQDGAGPYALEQIKFADNTVWDIATVKAKVIQGTAGNDTIVGYGSADVLDGGAGNDWLDGRGGNDTYKFGKNSGNDIIDQSYDTAANIDTLLLDAGIKATDVTVRRDGTGDDLLLTIAGASNVLRIKSYFYQDGAGPYALEQIKFADNTVWDIATVKAKVIQGTAGNDTIVGYGSTDVLDGGAGNDWLDGRGGNDTYKFGKNSGNDIIDQSYDTAANTDTLLLDAGIKATDVTVRRDGTGDDLLLTIAGASNVLRIKSYFYQDGAGPYALEQIKFADNTVWDIATVKAKVIQGTAGNDTIVGYGSTDVLDGGAGNDWLDGRGGNDTYKFGKNSGNDIIDQSYDTAANTDTLLLDAGIKATDVTVRRDGTGDDLLLTIAGASNVLRIKSYFYQDGAGPYALEQIKFADNTVWDVATVKAKVIQGTAGNDTIVGYGSTDVLDGGAGNDWLDGRGGNDTYKFGKNSGNDIIDQSYDTAANTDTLLLDAGIKATDVTVKRDGTGNDLLLTIAGASNVLRIKSYFYQDGVGPYAMEQIKFADNTVWDVATVKAKVIQGTAGNDTIVGYGSTDVLDGGTGNDWLDGRGGNDTYKFGKNSGNDIIDQSYDTAANTDTLLLDAGIKATDVIVKRDGTGNDLLLTITGASNVLRIKSYFYQDGAGPYAMEQIKFADNTVWDFATVKSKTIQAKASATPAPKVPSQQGDEVHRLNGWSLTAAKLDFHLNSMENAAQGLAELQGGDAATASLIGAGHAAVPGSDELLRNKGKALAATS